MSVMSHESSPPLLPAERLAARICALFGERPAGIDPVGHALAVLDRAERERRLPGYAAAAIEETVDALFAISAHEFDVQVHSRGTGEGLDGLAVAVNVLARELSRTAVSSAQMVSLIESLPNPVLVVTVERRVRYANPAARAMLGERLVGRTIHEVLQAEEDLWPEAATPVRLTALLDEAHLLFSVAPLISHFDEVEGFVAVGTNITDQVRTQKALADARDLAEANARARSQFLANMSHEIRTPLNGVLGMAQLLLDAGLGDEQAGLVRNIRASGEHLLALINDVLDFSKIDAGHLELDIRRFDPSALVQRSVDIVRHRRRPEVQVRLELDPGLPPALLGDALRVRQVLLNLVGNALKFTTRGEVVIACMLVAGDARAVTLRFEVRDTGVGISRADLGRLFDPFTQVDASATRRFGGTGLGLAIVQRMVTALGGQVGVESRLGRGSRFWFEAPFERAGEADVPDFDHTDPNGVPLSAPPRPQPEATPAAEPVRPDLTGRAVLIVEDNPVNQAVARQLVARMGAEVVLAGHGGEALAALRARRFDLILMDCQMPVMDGLEATRRLRRMPNGADVPVVALTADAVVGHRERCFAAGMDAYLSKPLRVRDLESTLARVLGSRTS